MSGHSNIRMLKGISTQLELGVGGPILENFNNAEIQARNSSNVLVPFRTAPATEPSQTVVLAQLTTAIDDLIDGAPGMVDTLNKLKNFIDTADDDILAQLIAVGNEVNQDVIDINAALNLAENVSNYTDELDNGVVRANPSPFHALVDLNVNLKALKDNAGDRNISEDGLSLDSAKLRATTVVSTSTTFNIGSAFPDGAFLTQCVVKVKTAFSEGCGNLTIPGFGVIYQGDLSETGTYILNSGSQAGDFVDGSFQGVATLDNTCLQGEAVVHIQSIAV